MWVWCETVEGSVWEWCDTVEGSMWVWGETVEEKIGMMSDSRQRCPASNSQC